MFKRVVAMGLCAMLSCVGCAFAADVKDPVASIKCVTQGITGTNGINTDYLSRGLRTTIGGRNLSRMADEPTAVQSPDESNGLGVGKGDKMAAVIQTMFGYDLSDYQYISFREMWDAESLPSDQEKIKEILMDRHYIGIKVGEFIPMGFLYKDNLAYTVVEQPDGSVVLSEYKLLDENDAPMATVQSEEHETGTPTYQLVDEEQKPVDRTVMDSLYQ